MSALPTLADAERAADARARAASGGTGDPDGIRFGGEDGHDPRLIFVSLDVTFEEIQDLADSQLSFAISTLLSGVDLRAVLTGAVAKGFVTGMELARLRAQAEAEACRG